MGVAERERGGWHRFALGVAGQAAFPHRGGATPPAPVAVVAAKADTPPPAVHAWFEAGDPTHDGDAASSWRLGPAPVEAGPPAEPESPRPAGPVAISTPTFVPPVALLPLAALPTIEPALDPVAPAGDIAASVATTGFLDVDGGRIVSTIDGAADHDWFRVTLAAGTTYRFTVSGSGSLDPSLVVRDARGVVVATDDPDDHDSDSVVVFTPADAGGYFLDVGGADGSGGTFTLSVSADVVVVVGMPPDLDTIVSRRLPIGGDGRSGVIGEPFEADHFVLRLHAGNTYRITATGDDGRGREALDDPGLLLSMPEFPSSGGEVRSGHANAAGDGTELLVTISESESYDLTVLAADGGTGAYRVFAELI